MPEVVFRHRSLPHLGEVARPHPEWNRGGRLLVEERLRCRTRRVPEARQVPGARGALDLRRLALAGECGDIDEIAKLSQRLVCPAVGSEDQRVVDGVRG